MSNHRLLLAEDNAFNQKVAITMLKKLGFEVDVANNGQEVLDNMANNQYAVIFMDCEMPVMDGYTATKKIRSQEQAQSLQPILIIAMTAHNTQEDRDYCTEVGMDDYIAKPFKLDVLKSLLTNWKLI